MTAGKIIKLVSDIVFITGLILAGVLLYLNHTGNRPVQVFVVSSGSMAPVISTGSVVVVAPQSDYGFGDIITFYNSPAKKETTTHRIVGTTSEGFKTAGDANDSLDPALTPADQVIGSVRLTVPYVGYLAAWAKTPPGFILLVIVPATIIIYEELKSLFSSLKSGLAKLTGRLRRTPSNSARVDPPAFLTQASPHERWEAAESKKSAGTSEPHLGTRPAILVPVFFALLITLGLTVSYFVDHETSAGNVFGASAPAATPTPPPGEPTPTPTPIPVDPFVDFVEAVSGTFGHCCDANNLSSDPVVAAALITGAPDSPPDQDFIQISDSSSVTARFVDNLAVDGPGADVRLHIYDTEFPGSALVELSADCSAFVSAGSFADTADVDLDLTPLGLASAVCVRITDEVAPGDTFPTLGFDLDAIEALNTIAAP